MTSVSPDVSSPGASRFVRARNKLEVGLARRTAAVAGIERYLANIRSTPATWAGGADAGTGTTYTLVPDSSPCRDTAPRRGAVTPAQRSLPNGTRQCSQHDLDQR